MVPEHQSAGGTGELDGAVSGGEEELAHAVVAAAVALRLPALGVVVAGARALRVGEPQPPVRLLPHGEAAPARRDVGGVQEDAQVKVLGIDVGLVDADGLAPPRLAEGPDDEGARHAVVARLALRPQQLRGGGTHEGVIHQRVAQPGVLVGHQAEGVAV
eukprot:COSAG04_NODE_169_length_21636_cov_32.919023_13_plen_159_part_00